MLILYRVSPYLSSNPNPMGKDKFQIINTCLDSFKKANNGSKVVIIADGFSELGKKIFKEFEVIEGKGGNIETFHQQLDEVCRLDNEEKVLLAEDDYLWLPGAIDKLERALDELELVSPYDHPGHYLEDRFKHQVKRMVLIDNQTYRECPSNTLTFATRAYVIKQNIELIKPFKIRDHELFQSLPVDMWCSVPSLATHLVENLLAPNIDWRKLWQSQ